MGELLNSNDDVGPKGLEHMKKQREVMMKNWEASGLLDGLTDTGNTKINIAEMMECEATKLLRCEWAKEESEYPPVMPIVRKVLSQIPEGMDIVAVSRPQPWYVYIVECSDGSYYTGISNDVDKRILTHNKGKGAKYTRARLPVVLKCSCEVENKSEAAKLEFKVKKQGKHQKIEFLRSCTESQ